MRTRATIFLAIVATACGSATASPTTTSAPVPPTSARVFNYPEEIEAIPDPRPMYAGFDTDALTPSMTLVARAFDEVPVFDSRDSKEPMTKIPATTVLGTPTVLALVKGPIGGRAKVMLPLRPNGTTGWIDVSDLSLYVVETKMVVDLSDRTLTYYENGELVLQTEVAIGTDRNPTPTGSFFVTDNVTLADPNSPWGPHAFGLSARSDTITEYNGGDGIIGIHGTNRPSSIGEAASLGCVRLPNDIITTLHEVVPIGTPVDIVA